jgi:hypothetical protein
MTPMPRPKRISCERCAAPAKKRPVHDPFVLGLTIKITVCDECASAIDILDARAWIWLRQHAVPDQ